MKIPALLLRQLYTFGSLENDAEGFRFSLQNRLSDAQLTRIHGISVDDTEVPLQQLRIDLGDGRTMAAADVTPQAPAPFALRQVARVIARGVPLANGSHEIRCDVETDSFGRLEICAMDAIATAQPPRPSIPWDPDQRANFGAEMVARRRRFAEEYSGVTLKHVSGYSFDPVVAAGNIENFTGVAQVPLGFAGPLPDQWRARQGRVPDPAGHDRGHAGRLVQPRDEGAQPLGRRDLHRLGATACSGRRSSSSTRRARRATSATGCRSTSPRSAQEAEATSRVARLPGHRHLPREQVRLPALQLHHRRRRGPEHGRARDLRRLQLDPGALP